MPEVQSGLLPSKLVEEVAHFATEETPLDMPEEKSPTLTIEGVLGELAPKVEATKG